MSDKQTQATEEAKFAANVRHLKSELRDRVCTGWTCPTCGWNEYKIYGLECDRCGFDASPYAPKRRKVSGT
jgi:ribosomal protein L37E